MDFNRAHVNMLIMTLRSVGWGTEKCNNNIVLNNNNNNVQLFFGVFNSVWFGNYN